MKKIHKLIIVLIILTLNLNTYASLENDTTKNYVLFLTQGKFSKKIYPNYKVTIYGTDFKVKGRVDSITEKGIYIKNRFIEPSEIKKLKNFKKLEAIGVTSFLLIPLSVDTFSILWIVNSIKNTILKKIKLGLGILYILIAALILVFAIYCTAMYLIIYLIYFAFSFSAIEYEKIDIIELKL